jgi:hypothetical protein
MIGQIDYRGVSIEWLLAAADLDPQAEAELSRRLAGQTLLDDLESQKSTKHGDHDQSEHGNWANGGSSTGTGTKEDPIKTNNVVEAARALGEGKHVQLSSPEKVASMLDELNKMAKDAGSGTKKVYDLCKVSVPGTNLFCVDSKGIPRIEMPQLKGQPIDGTPGSDLPRDVRGEVDITNAFVESMRQSGIGMEETSAQASFLKATQNELNGEKVAGIMQAARDGKLDMGTPLIVSRDNYIVDGHHRWAAQVALEYDGVDNPTTDIPINIIRMDADIIDILDASKEFAATMGIPQAAVKRLRIKAVKHGDHDQSEHGNWANAGGAGSGAREGGMQGAVSATEERGGATLPVGRGVDEWAEDRLTVIGKEPATGFAVATGIGGKIVPQEEFFASGRGVSIIDGFLEQNAEHFANPDHHLGLWHNKEDGTVYLDVTEVFDSSKRDEAIAAGSSRNQISIWDLENKVEIPTGGTGELTEGKAYSGSQGSRRLEDDARGTKEGRRILVRRSN